MGGNMQAWWEPIVGSSLAQGDLLENCGIPQYFETEGEVLARVADIDVIVLTQTCDLENKKAPFVALCPIRHLRNESLGKDKLEAIRQGKRPGLHMLASPLALSTS
jgi:hypothetical protein